MIPLQESPDSAGTVADRIDSFTSFVQDAATSGLDIARNVAGGVVDRVTPDGVNPFGGGDSPGPDAGGGGDAGGDAAQQALDVALQAGDPELVSAATEVVGVLV